MRKGRILKDYCLRYPDLFLKKGHIIEIQYRTAHGARFKLLPEDFPELKGRDRTGWIEDYDTPNSGDQSR